MKNAYVSYIEYTSDFKGILIPQSSFDNLAIKASSKINYYTFNRINIDNIDIKVIFATCEIAELLYEQDQLKQRLYNDKSTIASETVGPHSKTYVNKSNLQSQRILSDEELNNESYNICLKYLSRTGLIYRGV